MKGLVHYNIFWNDKLLIPKSLPRHLKFHSYNMWSGSCWSPESFGPLKPHEACLSYCSWVRKILLQLSAVSIISILFMIKCQASSQISFWDQMSEKARMSEESQEDLATLARHWSSCVHTLWCSYILHLTMCPKNKNCTVPSIWWAWRMHKPTHSWSTKASIRLPISHLHSFLVPVSSSSDEYTCSAMNCIRIC